MMVSVFESPVVFFDYEAIRAALGQKRGSLFSFWFHPVKSVAITNNLMGEKEGGNS